MGALDSHWELRTCCASASDGAELLQRAARRSRGRGKREGPLQLRLHIILELVLLLALQDLLLQLLLLLAAILIPFLPALCVPVRRFLLLQASLHVILLLLSPMLA